jgi:hypothetical protein
VTGADLRLPGVNGTLETNGSESSAQMKRCLLDSSFVIDLLNETVANEYGPARNWMERNHRRSSGYRQ